MSFVLLIGNDFSKLKADILRVFRLTTKTSERISCSFEISLLDVVSGGVWEEEKTAAENEGPGKLDSDRNPVCAGITAVFGGVDNDGGEQNTNGDAELVSGDKGTADFAWALQTLAHVACAGGRDLQSRTCKE